MHRDGEIVKHNTGVYVNPIPCNPITGLSNIDYETAEDLGYMKLDLLNVHVYNQVRSNEHLDELCKREPQWEKLKERDFVAKLIHLSNHFDEDMLHLEKWNPQRPISCVYFDSEKEINYVKRFLCEVLSDKRVSFISESEGSFLQVVSTAYRPEIRIVFNKLLKETKNLPDQVLNLADLIDVKGMKAQGNQVTKLKVKEILLTHEIAESKEPWPTEEMPFEIEGMVEGDESSEASNLSEDGSLEWDFTKKEDDDQPTLFD